MIRLKKQVNLFIIPTKNTWWIMKLSGIKYIEKPTGNNNSGEKIFKK